MQKISKFSFVLLMSPLAIFSQHYSGRLINENGTPVQGAIIALSSNGNKAVTNQSGNWEINTPSNVRSRGKEIRKSNKLKLRIVENRVSVIFNQNDLNGKIIDRSFENTKAEIEPAVRSASLPDTLIYSVGQKVFLRDTVSSDQQNIVRIYDTTWNANATYGWFFDARDSQIYRTIGIGKQVWFAENLNYNTENAYCYKCDSGKGINYGRLYSWATALNLVDSCNQKMCSTQVNKPHKGVCPIGWHIPTLTEWDALFKNAGNDSSGHKLKSSFYWSTSNQQDEYGFRILPSGENFGIKYGEIGQAAYIWSATEFDFTIAAWVIVFNEGKAYISEGPKYYKFDGFSIRCLMDAKF